MGYNLGTYGIDGKYGSITASAVKEFQRKSGITVDGIVGDETRAKFKAKGYLTGGRADSTGWAWLDGTPERPEYVLNAD
jgi:peptidoglycan hydrolase-like protein with peptidoglycan-binding domain